MILKPFKVHSPDGKSFYEGEAAEMTQSPAPASPSGEDAAEETAAPVAVGFRTRAPGFAWVPWLTDDQDAIRRTVDDAIAHGHEGEALYSAPLPRASEQADEAVTLPIMRAAFRVTETEGDPDPNKQRFHMRFTFRSMEELHAADDQWRAFQDAARAKDSK